MKHTAHPAHTAHTAQSANAAPASAQRATPSLALGASSRRANRVAAGVLIVTGALSLAPIAVLGPAIGWPGSLGLPAAAQLTNIGRAPGAVAAGYGLYLLYSLMVLPALGLAAHRLVGVWRSLVTLVVAFAALSALARCIGILRWLTVMPELSRAHAAADVPGRERIELVFDALNSYGGGVGELLGVSLFAGAAMLLLVVGAALAGAVPRWLTALGTVATACVLGLFLPAVGVPVDLPIALGVTLLSFWMWALGGWLLFAGRAGREGRRIQA